MTLIIMIRIMITIITKTITGRVNRVVIKELEDARTLPIVSVSAL